MEVFIMARIKSGKPIRKERLLQVLTNGGVITKRQIELTMQYKAMYRIPTELWKLKKMGAIVKSHKDGRKVIGYELLNVDEMTKLLTSLGFATLPLVSEDNEIKTLSDLKAKPAKAKAVKPESVAAPVIEDEVTEITE
jgi:DNA/RNA endonuclease G (NUC1)